MVSLTALWMPIVLSAVIVFVASSVMHMALAYHRSDYQKLPDEEKVLEAMRQASIAPGNYSFPHVTDMKDFAKPEVVERFKRGPVGMMNVGPSGPPAMGGYLALWFVYCLGVGFVVAYLTGRTLGPGAHYLGVFRIAGTAAFLAYAGGQAQDSIWRAQRWSTTAKHMFDGLVYALLTAGTFGWLWPR